MINLLLGQSNFEKQRFVPDGEEKGLSILNVFHFFLAHLRFFKGFGGAPKELLRLHLAFGRVLFCMGWQVQTNSISSKNCLHVFKLFGYKYFLITQTIFALFWIFHEQPVLFLWKLLDLAEMEFWNCL